MTNPSIASLQRDRARKEMTEKFPHVVECRKGGITNLDKRRERSQWLNHRLGPRGTKWDFFIRATGGSTMCFAESSEAVLFKLTWGGDA